MSPFSTISVRRTLIPLLATVGAALLATPARAQSSADSAGIARAIASVLAEQAKEWGGGRRIDAGAPASTYTPEEFDRTVATLLRADPRMDLPPRDPDKDAWYATRGFAVEGDTVLVRVETGMGNRAQKEGINLYIEQNNFLFVHVGDRWKYVRRAFVRGADYGPFRG